MYSVVPPEQGVGPQPIRLLPCCLHTLNAVMSPRRYLLFACLLLLAFAGEITAARSKKVLILDFKNLDKNPNYLYLESSITEAVKSDLKGKFVFKEMASEDWQRLAAENYFTWPEENYTKGFAVNVGRAGRQDVVIGGFFQAVPGTGKSRGTQIIKTHVFIMDVGTKKLVSEFDIELPTDAKLFESINLLASRVAEEAKSVLPTDEQATIAGVRDEPRSLNELRIASGVNLLSVPAAFSENFSAGKILQAKDIQNSVQVDAAYTRHDFYWPQVQLVLAGGVQFGSGEFSVATESRRIRATLLGFHTSATIGYRFEWQKFNFTPGVGAGFYLGRLALDYTTLTLLPVDSTGAERSGANLNISSPFFEGGFQLGYQLNPYLLFFLTTTYRQYVNIGVSSGQGYAGGGVGFRL